MKSDSKSVAPASTSLHRCTSASEQYEYASRSPFARCRSRTQGPSAPFASIRTRTGMVLMKTPTIASDPASADGRPDTIEPKTTSDSPL